MAVDSKGSAYGNPQPYPSASLERHMLEGRLKVAQSIASRARRDGNARSATRWGEIADELLDHLNSLEDRAQSAAMDSPPSADEGNAHDGR